MRMIPFSTLAVLSLFLVSCSSLTLENVHYGWPVEEVAAVSQSNRVESDRHGLSFSVAKIAENELQDSTALQGKKVRILRNDEGYYFLTAAGFKHVYVFSPGAHELAKESVIEVAPSGLVDPALNLRPPYVELIDANGFHKLLTHSDIVEGNSK